MTGDVRDRLVAAAARAIEERERAAEDAGEFATERDLARAVLNAVLPLMADEVEGSEIDNEFAAAGLLRSWAGEPL